MILGFCELVIPFSCKSLSFGICLYFYILLLLCHLCLLSHVCLHFFFYVNSVFLVKFVYISLSPVHLVPCLMCFACSFVSLRHASPDLAQLFPQITSCVLKPSVLLQFQLYLKQSFRVNDIIKLMTKLRWVIIIIMGCREKNCGTA